MSMLRLQVCVVALGLLLSPFALSQAPLANQASPALQRQPPTLIPPPAAQAPQPPNYANYSIMLVNPAGGAVVLMHNPQNALEYVDVSKTKEAFSAGYVPARAGEIGDLITALKEENARLTDENARLQTQRPLQVFASQPPTVVPAAPSQAQIEAQQRAQVQADKDARRRQLIQSWLMLQNMNRPQTFNMNVNVTDCTRFPALCVGR